MMLERDPPPKESAYWSSDRVHTFARLVATLGAAYICSLLWAPFLPTFTWALTLAILFAPAHQIIETRLKSPNLAAVVSVLLVALIVVGPAFFVAERLISEAASNADYVQRQISSSDLRQILSKHPWTATFTRWISQEIDLRAIVGHATSWLTNMGATVVRKSTAELASALITFYALFFLLRDRREALLAMMRISPLAEAETKLIANRVADTVHAIVYGTVLVSAMQGALGGLMFWWLGLPAPFLWGLVMGLLSIIPVLGAFVVWVPTAIVLALDGDWEKAVILALWGGLVVGTVDNFLRPILMSGRLRTHTFTTFISLVGGLNLFGAPGVILGPVAVTAAVELLDLWRAREDGAALASSPPTEPPTERHWHCASSDQVLAWLGVSANGLSTERASKLLAEYGPNALKETRIVRPWSIFFAQFESILIWVLIGAAALSGFLGDPIDSGIILAIVILDATVGFYQEYSAEKSIVALMRMTAPRAKVWRDGTLTTLASSEVVPGDVLELEAGDLVAADARLLNVASLTCVEAALTGESEVVAKTTEPLATRDLSIGDRKNMVFMGTGVATGSGKAIVVATAMNTQFGRIASLLGEASLEAGTPLEQKLESFGRILLWATLAIVSLLFGLGLWRGGDLLGLFMTSVSLAVAAIPESLPAVVTAALALGVTRMSKRRALIRRLASVETLGSTNVVCTDKTGTLTVGQMTVRSLLVAGRVYEVTGEGYSLKGDIRYNGHAADPATNDALRRFGEILVGCNSASFKREGDACTVIGDPTEGALLVAGQKAGGDREELDRTQPKILELPFDSDRKLRSVVRRLSDGKFRVLMNGAPEIVLERCAYMFSEAGIRKITPSDREEIAQRSAEFAAGALRVLASAFRDIEAVPLEQLRIETVERDLVFVGLSGLHDPPRPEAREAIARCHRAGVRVVMITGDHPHTAVAIGRELGIEAKGHLTGMQVDNLTDKDLAGAAPDTAIYARVSAEHKLRIVRAWQANKAVVAMTGDGVNDAPAIKAADIGIAMGRSGTEVTKQASDMIIADDNFATIVAAIEEGRGIFENIRKTLLYLLACNSGELLLMAICILLGLPAPLLPIHLLWINLVTDGPPALCLAADRVEPSVMGKGPRERNKDIADPEFFWTMILVAAPTAGVSFAGYAWGLQHADLETARTYAFLTLIFGQLCAALSLRSATPIWRQSLISTKNLLIVIGLSISLQIWMQHSEFFASILHTATISLENETILLAASVAPLLFFESLKAVRRRIRRDPDGSLLNQAQGGSYAMAAPERLNDLILFRGAALGAVAIIASMGGWLYSSWLQTPSIDQRSVRETPRATGHDISTVGVVSEASSIPIERIISGEVKSVYCNVGDKVRPGQLCAKIDPHPYEDAVERAKLDLAQAKKQLVRVSEELAAAKLALERRTPTRRRERSHRDLGRLTVRYQRAAAKTEDLRALVAQQESQLQTAELQLERTSISSPVSGTVVARNVEIGETLAATGVDRSPIFLVALPIAELTAQVSESDAQEIRVGDPVSIAVETIPGREFEGAVADVDQSAAPVKIRDITISVPNPEGLLKPHMTTQILIHRAR